MENVRRAFINENAIKNFREQARYAAAKERVVHAALNNAAKQVVALFGPNISMDASKDNLTEIRPGVFNGTVEAQLSVETGTGLKRIAYPINILASEAILGEDNEVQHQVEAELQKTESDIDARANAFDEKQDGVIAECQAALKHDEEVVAEMEETGLTCQEAEISLFNKKASANKEASCSVGAPQLDSNIGINSTPQTFVRIAAHRLPSYNVGDFLDLDGIPYVCVKADNEYVDFQLKVL